MSNEYEKAAGIEANIYVLIPPLQYVVADPGGSHCAPDTKNEVLTIVWKAANVVTCEK